MNKEILVAAPSEISVVALLSATAQERADATTQRMMPPFLHELLEVGLAGDALLTTPYTMSPRHAIWWACICAWHACARTPTPAENDAFALVVNWVRNPNQKVAELSIGDRLQTPLGCCRHAMWLSQSAGENRDLLRSVAKVLGYSAQLSLQQAKNAGGADLPKQFVLFGMEVSAGRVPWTH